MNFLNRAVLKRRRRTTAEKILNKMWTFFKEAHEVERTKRWKTITTKQALSKPYKIRLQL